MPGRSKLRSRGLDSTAQLSPDELLYLKSVHEQPHFMVTARGKHLGFGSNKNQKVRELLIKKGLLELLQLNFGKLSRGTANFVELTNAGYLAVEKKPPRANGFNCSLEHWFWQKQLCEHYTKLGFKAQIEMHLNAKRADVGVIQNGKLIAIEVGRTEDNETVNVVNDLEAGFHEVILGYRDTGVRNKVHRELEGVLTKEQWEKVAEKLLWEFDFVKDIVEMNRRVMAKPLQDS